MYKLLLLLLFIFNTNLHSNHHAKNEDQKMVYENNFAYLSTYTIPAGSNPVTLSKNLLKNVEQLKKNGYNNCGLLRHAFGGDRAFYTYCYFDTWEQFAAINDRVSSPNVRQLYDDHDDRLVSVDKKNLGPTKYLVMATYSFGPYLTLEERAEKAKIIFDKYDEGFGGCNLMSDLWGPGPEWQIVCGFNSYAEFAQINKTLEPIKTTLAMQKLDILDHTDNIVVRVK